MFEKMPAEQISYIFENTEDAVCLVSSGGVLLEANPAAEKLFGISADSAIKIWDAIPFVEGNDDLIQLFIDAVAQKLKAQEEIVDYVSNDGTKYNLHVRLNYFKKDDMSVYLVVITDLTKLIQVRSAFARYTSPDIADYVLTTAEGQKRGGLTQEVTILMSDLRGFTALSSKMPAQSLIGLLNHYFEAMVAVISKYGGTVIEFLGDGIFVVFGAPKEMPDHASNAVKCAIGMQNAIKEVNKWTEENGYPELAMGIGINTGSVVVGNIGSENKMKYGCMGQTVNIAGRLEGLTVGGQVLITDNTRQKLTGEFESCSEGSFLPKGAKDELKYYEVSKLDGLSVDTNYSVIVWTDCDKKKYDLHTVKEKTVEAVGHQATVCKISTDKKHALISCDYELTPRTNIMLQEGDNRIYAKVIKPEYDGYVICFTSVAQSV